MIVKKFEILVIGAGPGGLSLVAEARAKGFPAEDLLVLEKANDHSWNIRTLYPENKLVAANYKGIKPEGLGVLDIPDMSKQEALVYLERIVQENKVEIKYNQNVIRVESTGTSEQPAFKVRTNTKVFESKIVVLGIGIFGKPNKPNYRIPRKLRGKYHFDISNIPENPSSVLVVGGGDSAAEFAFYLQKGKHQVTMAYRGETFKRMSNRNLERISTLKQDNRIRLLVQSDIEKVEVSDKSLPLVVFKENAHPPMEFDHLIYALGGSTPEKFLMDCGIEVQNKKAILNKYGESAIPGLFVTGDLNFGGQGGSIASAFKNSKMIVNAILKQYPIPFKKNAPST